MLEPGFRFEDIYIVVLICVRKIVGILMMRSRRFRLLRGTGSRQRCELYLFGETCRVLLEHMYLRLYSQIDLVERITSKVHNNNESSTSHCRLCHACRPGFWKGSIGKCIECPPEWLDPILVGLAIAFVALLVYSFFQTAVEQFQEDDIHSHHHYGQTLKKIVINHFVLVHPIALE